MLEATGPSLLEWEKRIPSSELPSNACAQCWGVWLPPLCCLHGDLLGCGCWAGVSPRPCLCGTPVCPQALPSPLSSHVPVSCSGSVARFWGPFFGGSFSRRAGRRDLHFPAASPPSFPLSHSRPTSSAAPSGRSASADRAPQKPQILPRRCSSHPSCPSTLNRRDSSWQPPGSPFPPPATRPRGTRPPLSRCCSPRATSNLPSR